MAESQRLRHWKANVPAAGLSVRFSCGYDPRVKRRFVLYSKVTVQSAFLFLEYCSGGGKICLGHYSLILEKRYQEFCDVYREKGHLCKTDPGEYGDLQPGSQVRALLALGEYGEAAQVCREMMRQEAEESARRGYDARSSIWLIDLAVACMKQGRYAEAAQAIRETPHTNYQPNRIQAPCLMYYMALVMEDKDLKRESIKVFNARLRTKAGAEPAFAPVRFLRDKIGEAQLLSETAEETNPKLYLRALVPAKFLIAVKRYETGDLEGCRQALKETRGLYKQDHIAVMPVEYFLAESWLAELESQKTDSGSQ